VSTSVLDIPGFVVDLRDHELDARDRTPVWRLVLELRCLCRSAVRGGVGGFTLAENRFWWLTLRDIDPLAIRVKVMAVERAHPTWRLPGEPDAPIHARVEAYFSERR
jgi:hypothetical protein